jgi:fructose-1,6-bisphosphatase/inositol monophosphatase family enzyme
VPRGLDKEQVVLVPGRFHTLARLTVPCKLRNLGSIASHLSLVAAGGAAATLVGPGWSPWDVVAGMVLLEEVGGVALSLDGKPLDPVTGRPEPFVAGAAPACESVLASLRPQHPQRA